MFKEDLQFEGGGSKKGKPSDVLSVGGKSARSMKSAKPLSQMGSQKGSVKSRSHSYKAKGGVVTTREGSAKGSQNSKQNLI